MRQCIDLNGTWQFLADPEGTQEPTRLVGQEVPVAVPGAWQSALPDRRDYQGLAWYRRAFTVPAEWPWKRARLHFGAVDYVAEAWLNDVRLGEHRGGFTPFHFEVGQHLRPGARNELLLRVLDPPDDHPSFPRRRILQGKQNWYGDVSGPWQGVYLECLGAHVIEHAIIVTSSDRRGIELTAEIAPLGPDMMLSATISTAHGRLAAGTAHEVTDQDWQATLMLPNPRRWTPDTPVLYTVQLVLSQGGRTVDEREIRCGLRTIAAEDGRLLLNGEPLYLRGVLDQDYWPDGRYVPPSPDAWADQIRQVKDMGFNLVRIHVKPPDPRYLDLCDELGLLVWEDLPYAVDLGEPGWAELRDTLRAIVRRDANHPSVIVRSILNEGWGADLAPVGSEDDRHRLLDLLREARALDPTRLWVDNSACRGNFHLDTDVVDWHTYWAMPEHRDRWEETLDEFAGRADWLWSPHGDAHARGDEPLVLSEFGSWGLPNAPAIESQWWAGGGWLGCTPAGLAERFADSPLTRVFRSLDHAIAATQRHQAEALKAQIESLRRRERIVGYVLTELADQNWEANGLLDMWRSPKHVVEGCIAYNAADVLLQEGLPPAVRSGDEVHVRFRLSRYPQEPAEEVARTLHWQLHPRWRSGHLDLPADWSGGHSPGAIVDLGEIRFKARQIARPRPLTLTASLRDEAGRAVLSNSWTTLVVPPVAAGGLIRVYDPPGRGLAAQLAALGYDVQDWPGIWPVVSTVLDPPVVRYLERGGTALLLLDGPEAIQDEALNLEIIPREGPPLDGDWIGAWHWLDPGPLGLDLPGDEFLGFPFGSVLPAAVFATVADPWGGMTYGWFNEHWPWLGRVRHGDGEAIVTTLRLLEALAADDPVAALLAVALVERLSCAS